MNRRSFLRGIVGATILSASPLALDKVMATDGPPPFDPNNITPWLQWHINHNQPVILPSGHYRMDGTVHLQGTPVEIRDSTLGCGEECDIMFHAQTTGDMKDFILTGSYIVLAPRTTCMQIHSAF